jgi:hypothetical protein
MFVRRNVFLAVMLASLATRASAREGGLELTSTTGFRANPLALFQDFRLGYRWDLERPGGPSLLPYVQLAAAPGSVQAGLGLELALGPYLRTTLAYAPRYNFAGKYGFQSFDSPRAEYSDGVLDDRADAGLTYSTWQHRFVLAVDLNVPLGPVEFHTLVRGVKHSANLRAGDTVFYDMQLDLLVAARGWTLENEVELLYHPSPAWTVGLRNTLIMAWYPESAYRSGEPVENLNGPMIKLGPVASWTFAFRGSGWFDAPTVFANVGWWIKHRYRAGEDVSRAIPTAVIGFSFKSW